MRIVAFLLLVGCIAATATAQVSATLSLRQDKETGKPTARLTVVIEPEWHIPSLTQPDGGPARTKIELPQGQAYRLAGAIVGPAPHTEYSAAFDLNVETHEGRVEFVLPLERRPAARAADLGQLTVELTYQACSGDHCRLPATQRLTARLAKP